VSSEIRINLKIRLQRSGDGAIGNLEFERSGIAKNLADAGGFFFAIGPDGDRAGDGVACFGAEGTHFLFAFFDGFHSLEAEDISRRILRRNGGLQRRGA
jgi:hypothetical protein